MSYGQCTIVYNASNWQASMSCPPSYQGYINPKYKVVGIAYAVPGEQSYVNYTGTTMMGTSTSTASSFSVDTSTSVSICGSIGSVCGQSGGYAETGTYTNSFTQESDTSNSFAVNQTDSFLNQVSPTTGPCLDHGNDIIYVWVNPNVWYTTTGPGEPLQWNGYTYDLNDDAHDLEVVALRMKELENPSLIDPYRMSRLQRAWAAPNVDGSSPAITNQDLLNIAAQDPFSDPNYQVVWGPDGQTTTDDRFTQTYNSDLQYLPGVINDYGWQYSATTTAGQGGKSTYSDGFAIESKFGGSLFWFSLSYDLKNSETFTWVDQWNNQTENMTGEKADVHIVGPSTYGCADEYNVFEDNVYGTFMVAPI
jgi:hypothetical protein